MPESRNRLVVKCGFQTLVGVVTMTACGLVVVALAAGDRGGSFDRSQRGVVTGLITGDIQFLGPDGRPVRGVDVWASDSVTGIEAGRNETDDSGRFTLTVPPGRYTVSAGGRGAPLNVSYGARDDDLPPAPVVVREGERVEIHLAGPRATVLSGVIRDDRGQPIADASVELRPQATLSEWRKSGVSRQAGTDAEGAYRIFGVRPGAYVVFAGTRFSPIRGRDSSSTRYAPAPRFLPGTEHESEGATAVLHPGEDRANVDIMLPRQPVLDLVATAVLPDGSAFQGSFFVAVRPMAGPPFESSSYVSDGGKFFLALQRARYQLDVRAVSGPTGSSVSATGREYYSRSVLDVQNLDTGTFQVSLTPSMHVAGRVFVGSRPLGGVWIRLVPQPATPPAVREAIATSGQDGSFSADGLAAGRYLVELDSGAAGGWALDTVRLRGRAVGNGPIEVDRSIAGDELELTVVPTSASLSGQVIGADAAAVSSYVVVLLSSRVGAAASGMRTVMLARPDNTGRYLFSHQMAGPYVLFLLADPDPSDIDLLLEASKRDSSNGLPVVLKPDSDATLDLRIHSLADRVIATRTRVSK